VARGFDSKSVADQQEEAFGRHEADRSAVLEDPAVAKRRRTLELARVDVARRLAAATVAAHRAMLERSLEAIDAELAQLGPVQAASSSSG
jgi:hypothetical protein